MSKPVAGALIASRCVFVIRGTSTPFFVLFISSTDEPSGVVVPIPTLPDDGKVFCANAELNGIAIRSIRATSWFLIVFIVVLFCWLRIDLKAQKYLDHMRKKYRSCSNLHDQWNLFRIIQPGIHSLRIEG